LIDTTATTVFLLNAYFFTFEMKSVHEQILSTSYQDFQNREKRVKKTRNIFMIIAITLHAFHVSILIKRFLFNDTEDSISTPIVIIYVISALLRLTMESYIMYIAISYFIFVLKRRIAIYRKSRIPIPCRSIATFSWLAFILFLVFLEVFSIFGMNLFIP
jgi:hypothetical protein